MDLHFPPWSDRLLSSFCLPLCVLTWRVYIFLCVCWCDGFVSSSVGRYNNEKKKKKNRFEMGLTVSWRFRFRFWACPWWSHWLCGLVSGIEFDLCPLCSLWGVLGSNVSFRKVGLSYHFKCYVLVNFFLWNSTNIHEIYHEMANRAS